MTEYAFQPHSITSLRPVHDHILVTEMSFTERITTGGILLLNDDAKNAGIRPRWGKVYAIGPDQTSVKVGEYILIDHGRWTRGIKIEDTEGEKVIRRIDPKDILLVSDEPVQDDTLSDKVI